MTRTDPASVYFGDETAEVGDPIAVIGGRASIGNEPDRCSVSEFVWIGFDLVSPSPPPPPPPNRSLDPACYEPFRMTHDGYTITLDRAIWCTLDSGHITITTPEGAVIEGPTDWIIGNDVQELVLIDPSTGEPVVTVPADAYHQAVNAHMEAIRSSG